LSTTLSKTICVSGHTIEQRSYDGGVTWITGPLRLVTNIPMPIPKPEAESGRKRDPWGPKGVVCYGRGATIRKVYPKPNPPKGRRKIAQELEAAAALITAARADSRSARRQYPPYEIPLPATTIAASALVEAQSRGSILNEDGRKVNIKET
jgi:hypothetical protein